MKKKKQFCSFCASPLTRDHIEGKMRDYCPHCRSVFYENPLPVACSIVVNEEREVLLVQRKKEPYKSMWCLPIGFAETEEDVRDAALRELKEEAGVSGQIVRLIDVDTVDNYFYGHLAIVTYEIQMTGGEVSAGDDALDARFHPIKDPPPLAWSSNAKAIGIYLELYKDNWAMLDSFKYLFPEVRSVQEVIPQGNWQETLLSNVLVQLLIRDMEEINARWTVDVIKTMPQLATNINKILETNRKLLQELQFWLRRDYDSLNLESFVDRGRQLCTEAVPLPELLMAMSLSRKTIWQQVVRKRILSSPLEVYTALELNNRIILFYDRVNYHLMIPYEEILRMAKRK